MEAFRRKLRTCQENAGRKDSPKKIFHEVKVMKKSFVAMALILVLCMSQFLIGNAEGKALDITDTIAVNEGDATAGAFTFEKANGEIKVAGTANKGAWAFLKGTVEGNAKEYAKLVIKVEGKAGVSLKLKFEGGTDAEVIETGWPQANFTDPVLVDGEQTIEWTLNPAWLTSNGGQTMIIFVNPDKAGATEQITIKSVKLVTADYVEPVVPETPETGDSFNMVPAVMMVLAAFVFVAAYAKKRAF